MKGARSDGKVARGADARDHGRAQATVPAKFTTLGECGVREPLPPADALFGCVEDEGAGAALCVEAAALLVYRFQQAPDAERSSGKTLRRVVHPYVALAYPVVARLVGQVDAEDLREQVEAYLALAEAHHPYHPEPEEGDACPLDGLGASASADGRAPRHGDLVYRDPRAAAFDFSEPVEGSRFMISFETDGRAGRKLALDHIVACVSEASGRSVASELHEAGALLLAGMLRIAKALRCTGDGAAKRASYRTGIIIGVTATADRLGLPSPEALTMRVKRAEANGPDDPLYPLVVARVKRKGYHEDGIIAAEAACQKSGGAAFRKRRIDLKRPNAT